MMGVCSIAIWSGIERICKCPCLSGFVDNSLDLSVSRSGVNLDEKIRRVYRYLVMDYLVEHNQSCS